MKKYMFILIVLLIFVNNTASATTKELDMWIEQKYNFSNSTTTKIPGYYLFKYNPDMNLKVFKEKYIEHEMYIPIDIIDDEYRLYYLQYSGISSLAGAQSDMNQFYSNTSFTDVYYYTPFYPTDSPPIIETDEITAYLSKNYSLYSLLEQIRAFDYKDGDISYKIKVESENYTNNKTQGKKEIVVSVTDSNYNKVTKSIIVNVIDDTAPLITTNKIYTTKNFLITEEILRQSINVIDCYGGELEYEVNFDNYINNNTLENTYTYEVIATYNNCEYITSNEIIVLESKYNFYTNNKTNIIFDQYRIFSDDDYLYLFNLLNNISYDSYTISPAINEDEHYYNVYYEFKNNDELSEYRLSFSFNSIEENNVIRNSFNISILIKIICIALIVLTISYHITILVLNKKRSK